MVLNEDASPRVERLLGVEPSADEIALVLEDQAEVAHGDESGGMVLAEVWEQVVIGAPEPGSHVTFEPGITWSVERIDDD